MRPISRWPGQWSSTAPQVSDHNGQRQVAWLVRGEPFRVPLLARSMVTVRSLPDHSEFERHVRVEMVVDGLHGEDATVYPWFARLEWLGPLDMTGEVDQVADGYAAVPAVADTVPVSIAHSLVADMSQGALAREADALLHERNQRPGKAARDRLQETPEGRSMLQRAGDAVGLAVKQWLEAGAQQCQCQACRPVRLDDPGSVRMIVCQQCGNKRCPHAADHRNECTGSNEPGQPGSAYPIAPLNALAVDSAASQRPQISDGEPAK